jgi:hypothetical protein
MDVIEWNIRVPFAISAVINLFCFVALDLHIFVSLSGKSNSSWRTVFQTREYRGYGGVAKIHN